MCIHVCIESIHMYMQQFATWGLKFNKHRLHGVIFLSIYPLPIQYIHVHMHSVVICTCTHNSYIPDSNLITFLQLPCTYIDVPPLLGNKSMQLANRGRWSHSRQSANYTELPWEGFEPTTSGLHSNPLSHQGSSAGQEQSVYYKLE